jgi:CBS domain-containing protein
MLMMLEKPMLTAAHVMTTKIVSVTPQTPIRHIAKLMCTKRISGVPVVDEEKRVIGIVSGGDLTRHADIVGEQHRPWWLAAFTSATAQAHDYIKTHGHTARDVMSADVITVAPTTSLAEIAKLLQQHRIKRVPVVEGGKLVGIVARGDLLRALTMVNGAKPARVDDRAIREGLFAELENRRWAHLLNKNIIVRNGVVDLSGFVESEDERHALQVAVENVPGVQRLEDHTRMRPLFRLG